MLRFRPEVLPFLAAAVAAGGVLAILIRMAGGSLSTVAAWGGASALVLAVYFLYFFRDPVRTAPADPAAIVSAAEGRIAAITPLTAEAFRSHAERSGLRPDDLGRLSTGNVTRISVFLSPLNVHVNRAPMDGKARFLGYFPGKHIFTFQEKSSEENQHNSILLTHARTICLINQIVGPVCRRVVYFLSATETVPVHKGDRIGMMKFGSRLDMYYPADDISVVVQPGDFVRAGETVVARLKP